MDFIRFRIVVKHGVRSENVSAVTEEFAVRTDAVLCSEAVDRCSQKLDDVKHLTHAVSRKDFAVEKSVTVFEKVFDV